MKPESGKSLSIWAAGFNVPEFEALKNDIDTDVCVIGGGITGLTTAYLLSLEGKKVTLADDGNIGGGESGRTTAHITSVIDDRYSEIERLHGEEASRLAARSEVAAIDMIEKIVSKENIECDFKRVNGYLFFKPDDMTDLTEYDACMRAGIKVDFVKSPFKGFKYYSVLKFDDQAQFHILKYLTGLSQSIVNRKGRIFTHTFITSIEEKESNVEVISKDGFKIRAKDVVVATNSPISNYKSIHPKQAAYRTYVIGFKIKKDMIPDALLWDTENPYHYIRVVKNKTHDILLVGGEDHKTGQDDEMNERFVNLENWSKEHFENLGEIKYKWSGQVLEPTDGLSFIGKDPEHNGHIFIATGDSGMGITHGTYAAIINTDLIMGRENEWSELYDPKRITLKALPEFLKEGISFISKFAGYVSPGDVKFVEDIQNGEGAVMRDGFEKIAVYKDKDGNIHEYSALCPHLKCILQWNNIEKSWDCPCHGSRFDAYGKVLNGPAMKPMEPITSKKIRRTG